MNKLFKHLSQFITLAIISISAFGYTPTVESLFRNGNNVEVGTNTLAASMYITRLLREDESELTEGPPRKTAYKFVIGNENEDRPRLVQLDYRNGVISNETMNRIHVKNLFSLKKLGLSNEQEESKVFYSLISSLLLNKSDMMMNFLTEIEPSLKKNKELIDKDHLSLLNNYRWYLKKKNEDENSEELVNPLKPENEEKMELVKKTLERSLLLKSPSVKRVLERDEFFWDIQTDKIFARFENKTHQLKKLTITTMKGKIEIDLHHYVIFGGGIEFPEIIYFKDLAGQTFEIKMSKISHFKDNANNFDNRIKRYEKALSNTANNIEEIVKPPFVM